VAILIMTERLLIRPLAPTDIEAVHAVFSDPEVMRYVPGGACDHERSLTRLRSLIDHQQQHGFSKWAVIERTAGCLVGDCGLQYLDGGPDIELGFHLGHGYWGQGYATEAAGACLAWARAERAERVVAIADPANQRSTRVLRKIGMTAAGTGSYFGREWLLFVTSPLTCPAG
jgi:RimJ/RimL family protein N-acetyltransferase